MMKRGGGGLARTEAVGERKLADVHCMSKGRWRVDCILADNTAAATTAVAMEKCIVSVGLAGTSLSQRWSMVSPPGIRCELTGVQVCITDPAYTVSYLRSLVTAI